tara:strand:- start:319 stop:1617 length:1299 start_codon:yes stop_codon:yes gene_type:complete
MSQVSSSSEFEFRDVILSIPERGIEIDISLSILELSLFESVNVPYTAGQMLCADTQSIFQELQMDGTERLKLNIISSEFEYNFTRDFIITRTIGKVQIGESGHAYNFYIAEESFFANALNKISKTYSGKPHEIIKNVLSTQFNKELNLIGKESAQAPFSYISPFISPFEIIDNIRKRSCDVNGYPFFVYASLNDDKIRMKSLSDIIETAPINNVPFTYSPAQNFNPNREKQLTNIEAFEELGANDTVELLLQGAVQNQYNTLNLSTNQKNINNRFNITEVLDAKENSIFNKDFTFNDKKLNEYNPNVIFKLVNYTTADELGYHDEADIEKHMNKMKSNSLISALEKKKINIVLPGLLNYFEDIVFVGEQIIINLPKHNVGVLDEVASGPYIVLQTKHMFKENKYSMGLTCSKLTNATDKTIAVSPTGYSRYE